MNPLLEQFLSESRELIERCSDSFLMLEQDVSNPDILNALFRYVHTIKGGSGLFDIAPFTQLVHVAEDSLSRARNGELVLNADCIDVYLQVLDQLTVWLNELEDTEQLPDQAVFEGKRLIKVLQDVVLSEPEPNAGQADNVSVLPVKSVLTPSELLEQAGLDQLSSRSRAELTEAMTTLSKPALLIVYRPEENAFFSGDDPINHWLQLPELRWELVEDQFDDTDLEIFDPYLCRLSLYGLTLADRATVEKHLSYVLENVQLFDVAPAGPQQQSEMIMEGGPQSVPALVAQAQLRLLRTEPQIDQPASTRTSALGILRRMQQAYPTLAALEIPNAGDVDEAFLLALENTLPEIEASAKASRTAASKASEVACESASELVTPAPEDLSMALPGPAMANRDEKIKTIKVDQERLEQLVDLTGELIVAKNSMQHLARRVEDEYGIKQLARELKTEHAVLNRISESLQGVVMQIRMIPVSTLFQRFPRLVRDLSRRLGKKIDLVIEGEETEADKNIVEQLADPLIHLVRNSIDHGIEVPAKRAQTGKPETGTIRLIARTIEDSVQIEILDDGNGIDPVRIREKAIAGGVIGAEEAANLTDQAALQLIFEPGFSTCEQVTDLSGRGVGMDVVKTTVTRIGGTIDVESEVGQGTTIRVTLPASITVSRVMMFEMAGQVYGIPVELLTETIKISPERIKTIKTGEAYVLRKQLIPIYRMARLLGLRTIESEDDLSILNLNLNGKTVGFVVDRLLEGVDVIVKPMDGVMARFPIYSGAAVLGDGRVLLVINPKEMELCH
ncbi:chemotaxis protein CheW [Marinobacter sediminum]|uniref:chemotaxis protein CheA n=1 Tax=Marinobacter sediminum TaxID=256323 RepID=UPI0035647AF5